MSSSFLLSALCLLSVCFSGISPSTLRAEEPTAPPAADLPTTRWNHVAIGVADIAAASTWYQQIFGMQQVRETIVTGPDGGLRWDLAKAVFGPDVTCMKLAHLSMPGASTRILQLFEIQPAAPVDSSLKRTGLVMVCLIVPDPAAIAKRIAAAGGKILIQPKSDMIFCQDPFGNTFELTAKPL